MEEPRQMFQIIECYRGCPERMCQNRVTQQGDKGSEKEEEEGAQFWAKYLFSFFQNFSSPKYLKMIKIILTAESNWEVV